MTRRRRRDWLCTILIDYQYQLSTRSETRIFIYFECQWNSNIKNIWNNKTDLKFKAWLKPALSIKKEHRWAGGAGFSFNWKEFKGKIQMVTSHDRSNKHLLKFQSISTSINSFSISSLCFYIHKKINWRHWRCARSLWLWSSHFSRLDPHCMNKN